VLRKDPLQDTQALIRSVYAYVAYRIGDGADAEDVTSATFERAVRYRKTYDPRKGDPIAWLIGIARHCISDLRVANRMSHGPEELPASGDLEDDAIRRLMLRAAVADLEEPDRELVALRFGVGLTARQIGELTGRRTNTVEVALLRLLNRLRSALSEPEDGETAQTARTRL
jgi:RNA polymerase sigma-70 factor, ECF subfamily